MHADNVRLTTEQEAAIAEARKLRSETRRVTVESLDDTLYVAVPVLDHGFVRVIDYMGDDSAVVQAARVSYGTGTKRRRSDAGLISYLMRNQHNTPFEMCEIKLHVKLPIFVARQWIRHRTANVNEYSARYSLLDKEFYVPSSEELRVQAKGNRQGRGDAVGQEEANSILRILREDAEQAYSHYEELLNERADGTTLDDSKFGIARELARMNLSLNFYTQWYWKTDLHNLMNFVRLRIDNHAQWEIQEYARVILDVLKRWVPVTYEAFIEYRLESLHLSRKAIEVVKKALAGDTIDREKAGIPRPEWEALIEKLGLGS